MTLLIAMLKVSALLALTLAAAAAARRRSAAWRHWILGVGILGALLLPAMQFVVPVWEVVRPAVREEAGAVGVTAGILLEDAPRPAPATLPGRWPGAEAVLLGGWVAGMVLSLGSLAVGLWRLSRIKHRSRLIEGEWLRQAREVSRALGLRRRVTFHETIEPALLVTWGDRRPEVLLPAGADRWPSERIRIVAAHELAHVRRGDWPIQLLGELLRIVYWFHPLAWLACRQLRQESECACDDLVLGLGIPRTAYATELLDLARDFTTHTTRWLPAPAIARPSTLQRRIRAMLDIHLDRRPLSPRARLAGVMVMLLASASIAAIGAQAGATVSGTVTDPSGRGIAGVTLTLSNPSLGLVVEAKTTDGGAFDVPVVAGTYKLEARHPGFAMQSLPLTLAGGERIQRALVLTVGTLQETVTVRGGPAEASAPSRRASVTPKPCTPSAAGGHIVPPIKISNVPPVYPADFVAGPTGQTSAPRSADRRGRDGRGGSREGTVPAGAGGLRGRCRPAVGVHAGASQLRAGRGDNARERDVSGTAVCSFQLSALSCSARTAWTVAAAPVGNAAAERQHARRQQPEARESTSWSRRPTAQSQRDRSPRPAR